VLWNLGIFTQESHKISKEYLKKEAMKEYLKKNRSQRWERGPRKINFALKMELSELQKSLRSF
jgi:hypothetical protein